MNPTDLDWWWQYGLDGFFGGLVTAAAVLVTLRHERRATRLASAQEVASSLASKCMALGFDITAEPPGKERWWLQPYREIQALALELEARTYRDWPHFAVEEARSRKTLTAAGVAAGQQLAAGLDLPAIKAVSDALTDLSATATLWLGNPKVHDSRWARYQAARSMAALE